MPRAVEYAAAGTDGERLFVFGGRNTANTASNGFDIVQVYIVAKNRWVSSVAEGVAPLPQARAGLAARAPFIDGEFWVMGGQTVSGDGATSAGVYTRTDIYDPASNTWRAGPALVEGRHGAAAIVTNGDLVVLGGHPSTFAPTQARLAQTLAWTTPLTTTSTSTSTTTVSTVAPTTQNATASTVATSTTTTVAGPPTTTRFRITTPDTTTATTTTTAAATTTTTTTVTATTTTDSTVEASPLSSTSSPMTQPPASASAAEVLLMHRINCGATQLAMDPAGRLWSPDYGFNGGTVEVNTGPAVFTSPGFETEAVGPGAGFPALYATARMDFAKATPDLVYSLRVPSPGRYLLRLYFAEVSPDVEDVGGRLMDLLVENMLVQTDLDIVKEAGGVSVSYALGLGVYVGDGTLDVELRRSKRYTKLNGLELFAEPGGVPLAPSLLFAPPSLARVGEELLMNISANDPNGDSMAFALLEARNAPGAILESTFGEDWALLRWTPLEATAPGLDAVFSLTVGDFSGRSDSITFSMRAHVGTANYGWRLGALMPVALAEVACGVVDGLMLVVGHGDERTLVYELATGVWRAADATLGTAGVNGAPRPYPGNHHAAEVANGRLYLIGGLDEQALGKVQILDVASGLWSEGAPLPWSGGSVATALIKGHIYACGGIVGVETVSYCGESSGADGEGEGRDVMKWGRLEGQDSTVACGTEGRRRRKNKLMCRSRHVCRKYL